MEDFIYEGEFIELSFEHPRRVATPEGAAYFDEPIGTIITKDMILAKKAAKALKGHFIPDGALVHEHEWANHPNNPANAGSAATHSVVADAKGAAADVKSASIKAPKISKSTISGNYHFNIQGSPYSAPPGSKIFKPKGSDGIAHVRTPDGKVHTFVKDGEVIPDPALQSAMNNKFGADFAGDDKYELGSFDKVGSSSDLGTMAVGQKLHDTEGNHVFTKVDDNTWQHEGTGFQVGDKDIKDSFDSGDLVPGASAEREAQDAAFADNEHTDFSTMTSEEATQAFSKMPTGTQFHVDTGTEETPVITKAGDNEWHSSASNAKISDKSLSYLKNSLKLGKPSPSLEAKTAKIADKAAKDAEKKAADSTDVSKPDSTNVETPKVSEPVVDKNIVQSADLYGKDKVGKKIYSQGGHELEKTNGGWKNNTSAKWGDNKVSQEWEIAKDVKAGKYTHTLSDEQSAKAEQEVSDKLVAKAEKEKADAAAAKAKAAEAKAAEEAAQAKKVEDAKDFWTHPTTDKPLLPIHYEHAPLGTSVYKPVSAGSYTQAYKKFDDGWHLNSGSGLWDKKVTSPEHLPQNMKFLTSSTETNYKKWAEKVGLPDVEKSLATSENNIPKGAGKPVTVEDMKKFEPGTPVITQNGTKLYSGLGFSDDYAHDDGTREVPSESVQTLANSGKLHTFIDPESGVPTDSDYIGTSMVSKEKFLTHAKSGDTFAIHDTFEGATYPYQKLDNGKFLDLVTGTQWDEPYDTSDPEQTWYKINDDNYMSDFKKAGGEEELADWEKALLDAGTPTPNLPEPDQAFTHEDQLNNVPTGDYVYADLYGEKGWKAVKLGNGKFLDEHGNTYNNHALTNLINQDMLHYGKTETVKPYNQFKAGDKIEKYSDINKFPAGASVDIKSSPDAYIAINAPAFKNTDGTWQFAGYESDPKAGVILPDEMAGYVKDGQVFFAGNTPDLNPSHDFTHVPEDIMNNAVDSAKETSTDQLFPGGPIVSQANIEDAVKGLEGHSGFQIKYGLKNLDDKNPLKNSDTMQSVTDHVMSQFTGVNKPKPKSALLEFLKKKGGLQSETSAADKAFSDVKPKILVGSDSGKSNKQGNVGGEFTAAELSDAIDILKNSDSKFIKSTLEKKNNPVGKLDPASIVGIDKDKVKMKQTFIDTLQAKLDKLNGAESVSGNEPSVDTVPDVHVDGPEKISSLDYISNAPIGTKVMWKGPNTDQEVIYTKQSESEWLDDTTGSPVGNIHFGAATEAGNMYKLSEPAPVENHDALKEAKQLSKEEVDNLPVGSSVHLSEYGASYIKKEDGKWYKVGGPGIGVISNDLVMDDKVTLESVPDYSPWSQEKFDSELTPDTLLSLPTDSIIKLDGAGSIDYLTKQDDGSWKFADGNHLGVSSLNHLLSTGDWKAYVEHKPVIEEGGPVENVPDVPENHLDEHALWALDEGSVVQVTSPFNGKITVVKKGQYFEKSNGSFISAKTIASADPVLVSKPQATPDYAHTPEAVQSKAGPIDFTAEDAVNAPEGTVLEFNNGKTHFVSEGPAASWAVFNDGTLQGFKTSDDIKALVKSGDAKLVAHENPHYGHEGKLPGLYGTGVYDQMDKLYLNADGTSVFLDKNQNLQSFNKADTSTLLYSYSVYKGVPNDIPKMKAKGEFEHADGHPVNPASLDKVPNGLYYQGSFLDPKTPVYEVKDGNVTLHTEAAIPPGTGTKKGSKVTDAWAQSVGTGARFTSAKWSGDEYNWTKNSDGTWTNGAGETKSFDDIKSGLGYWGLSSTKVLSHGEGTPKKVTKSKFDALLTDGKVLDESNSSVIPKGHTGSVTYFGGNTNIPNLVSAKKAIAGVSDYNEFVAALKKNGAVFNQSAVDRYAKKFYGINVTDTASVKKNAYMKAMEDKLNQLTDGVEVEHPKDENIASHFQYDSMGNPKMPASFVGASSTISKMEAAKKAYGDDIIGLPNSASYNATDWNEAYVNGDFAKMYDLEVNAYAQQNQAHPKGWLHPGSPVNPETNHVQWGATVEGELPAGHHIDGNWSSNSKLASSEELDNYLIKAQMQNPEWLSTSEKRVWVQRHRDGDKLGTDALSAKALARKEAGEDKLSTEPVWTDNVEPGKSYTAKFDSTAFPQNWGYYEESSMDYFKEHFDDPELKTLADQEYTTYNGSAPVGDLKPESYKYFAYKALNQYFAKKQADFEEAQKKPNYVLHPEKSKHWKKGIHSSYPILNDNPLAGGDEWVFKPIEPDGYFGTDGKWRTDTEIGAGHLGKQLGFNTPNINGIELDPNGGNKPVYGSMQKMADVQGSLGGVSMKDLTKEQVSDLALEHVLDHFLEQDDTWNDNVLVTSDGHLLGIDKGRAFATYGANWTTEMNPFHLQHTTKEYGEPVVNTNMVYDQLYRAMRDGEISPEAMDAAYLAVRKRAVQITKKSNQILEDTLRNYLKDRPDGAFNLNYKIDGKKVENSLDGLVAAVLDRKSKIADDFENMWAKIYKAAGREKPELPKNPFESTGHHNSLESIEHHQDVFKHGSLGSSTLVGGDLFFHDGQAMNWLEHDTTDEDGKYTLAGKGKVDHGVGEKLWAYLSQNSTTVNDPKGSSDKGISDVYWGPVLNAAKTVNKHAGDGEYNQSTMSSLKDTENHLEKDLNFLQVSPHTTNSMGKNVYKLPSGIEIPEDSVGQFSLMAKKYLNDIHDIQAAHGKKETVANLSQYSPIALEPTKQKFLKSDGSEKIMQLPDGSGIHQKADNSFDHIAKDSEAMKAAKSGADNWVKDEAPTPEAASTGVKITHTPNSTHVKKGIFDTKTQTKHNVNSALESISDVEPGGEYKIELPTGETIYFRDTTKTNTALTQWNQLQWKVGNVSSADETSAAMSRIISYLNSLGFNLDSSNHTSAELAYWREMADQLLFRSHDSGSAQEKAAKALKKKMSELGTDKFHVHGALLDALGEDGTNDFWRGIWSDALGKEKVDNWLADEKYLPELGHANLSKLDSHSGIMRYRRLDLNLEDILKKNLTVTTSTKDAEGTNSSLDYYKLTGGEISNQEQWRILGRMPYYTGSAGNDLKNGGGDTVFSKFNHVGADGKGVDWSGWYNETNIIYDPRVFTYTGFYGNDYDAYGDKGGGYGVGGSTPKSVIYDKSSYNDVNIPWMGSLLDDIAMYVVRYSGSTGGADYQKQLKKRQEFIDYLHSLGVFEIRGMPVEDRIVMKDQRDVALKKVIEQWKKQ